MMTVESLSLGGGRRLLLSTDRIDSSDATVFEGLLESPSEGARPVAFKLAGSGDPHGSRIESERRFYEAMRGRGRGDTGLSTPIFFGSAKTNGKLGLVLERGMFPLDRVCAIVPGQDPILRDMIYRISAITAARLVTTLSVLADISRGRGRGRTFAAHRDIRAENILAIERDGVLDVVLADWGHVLDEPGSRGASPAPRLDAPAWTLAPEQRGSAGADVPSDQETDLWAVGVTLWRLLHQGELPLRRSPRGPRILYDDPLINDARVTFVVDVAGCASNGACLMKHQPDDPIHRLATDLLMADATSGGRAQAATAALAGLVETLGILLRDQVTQPSDPSSGAPLPDEVVYANLLRGRSLLFPASPRPERFTGALPHASAPSPPWLSRVVALVRGLPLGIDRVLALVAALLIGAFAGWAATVVQQWQIMPLPDPDIDAGQGYLTAIVCGVLGVGLFLGRLAIRRRSGAGYRRALDVTAIPAAGLAAAGAVALGHAFLREWPALGVGVALCVGAAVLAGGVVSLLPLGRPAALRRRSTPRRGPRATSVVSAAAAALIAVAVAVVGVSPASATSLREHAIEPMVDETTLGIPTGDPAFFNPDHLAASPDGDVAVVDEYAPGEDTVWLIPHDGSAARAVFRTYPLEHAPDPAALNPLQRTAEEMAHPSAGARVTTIAGIAFLGSDLVVMGSEGITRLDISGTTTVATRITTKVSQHRDDRSWNTILVSGSTIYAVDAESTIQGPAQRFCDSFNISGTERTPVITIDADTGAVTPYTWSDSSGTCVYNAWGLTSFDGKVGIYGLQYVSPTESREGFFEPYVSLLNGSDLHPFPQLKGVTSFDHVVVADDRVFARTNSCIIGFSLSKSAQLPLIVNSSTYSNPTDPECAPTQPGFLGAVTPAEFTWKVADARTCAHPKIGSSVLVTDGYYQNPVAADANGTVYLVSAAGPRCTPTVWSLAPHQGDWQPLGSIATEPQNGRIESDQAVTTMTAIDPSVEDDVVHWSSPQFSYHLGDRNTSGMLYTVSYSTLDRITQVDIGDLSIELGTGYQSGVPTLGFAKNGYYYNSGLQIPGATAIARSADGQLLVARCGQLLSIDPTQASLTQSGGLLTTDQVHITVVAGSNKQPQSPCAPIRSIATDIHTGLVPTDLAPVAVSSTETCAKCGETYVLAESGTFGTQKVSRITEIDTTAATVTTVGYRSDGSPASGDLAPLGLTPTDVAIDPRGRIAATTMSSKGYGPVLLFIGGKRSVVQLPSTIQEPSGVAWLGKKLVVTDAASGNVVELSLPAS